MSFKTHENTCVSCLDEARRRNSRPEGVAMLVLNSSPGVYQHFYGVQFDTLELIGNGILQWEDEDGSLVNLVNPGTYTFVFV